MGADRTPGRDLAQRPPTATRWAPPSLLLWWGVAGGRFVDGEPPAAGSEFGCGLEDCCSQAACLFACLAVGFAKANDGEIGCVNQHLDAIDRDSEPRLLPPAARRACDSSGQASTPPSTDTRLNSGACAAANSAHEVRSPSASHEASTAWWRWTSERIAVSSTRVRLRGKPRRCCWKALNVDTLNFRDGL